MFNACSVVHVFSNVNQDDGLQTAYSVVFMQRKVMRITCKNILACLVVVYQCSEMVQLYRYHYTYLFTHRHSQ